MRVMKVFGFKTELTCMLFMGGFGLTLTELTYMRVMEVFGLALTELTCMRLLKSFGLILTEHVRATQEVNTRTAERMVLAQLEVYKEPGVNVFTEDRDFMYVSTCCCTGVGRWQLRCVPVMGRLKTLGAAFQ